MEQQGTDEGQGYPDEPHGAGFHLEPEGGVAAAAEHADDKHHVEHPYRQDDAEDPQHGNGGQPGFFRYLKQGEDGRRREQHHRPDDHPHQNGQPRETAGVGLGRVFLLGPHLVADHHQRRTRRTEAEHHEQILDRVADLRGGDGAGAVADKPVGHRIQHEAQRPAALVEHHRHHGAHDLAGEGFTIAEVFPRFSGEGRTGTEGQYKQQQGLHHPGDQGGDGGAPHAQNGKTALAEDEKVVEAGVGQNGE